MFSIKPVKFVGLVALALVVVALVACGDATGADNRALSFTPVPTVTPDPYLTAEAQVSPTPENVPSTSVAAGASSTTAAPGPVVVEGAVQKVQVTNNTTVVVINNTSYALPPELVKKLGPALKEGNHLKLSGQRQGNGTLVVSQVEVVNNAFGNNQGNDNGKGKGNDDKDKQKGNKDKGDKDKGDG